MTTRTDEPPISGQATVMWETLKFDKEATKKAIRGATDQAITRGEDLCRQGLREYLLGFVPTVIETTNSLLQKMGVTSSETKNDELKKRIDKSLDDSVDGSVTSTGKIARNSTNWCTDSSVDSTASLQDWVFSFFSKK
ncbi:MAG: hypothetical protein KR126chlam3_01706 [Chlamydiae bacterium]|nr:hypothetical protein [Chlamydiota bacterium]